MVDKIQSFQPIGAPIKPASVQPRNRSAAVEQATPFQRVLEKQLEEVKFSSHARMRLETRNLTLSDGAQDRLNHAVSAAASKGARESLVLMDDLALVVSIPNRTVITAMANDEMRSHVFTQIDSAVIA